jgi:hypothetical protein
MSRQLGIGLATVGLAGLLVSALPTVQFGSSAALPGASTAAAQQAPGVVAGPAGTNDLAGEGAASTAAAAALPDKASPRQYDASGSGSDLNGVGVYGATGSPGATQGIVAAPVAIGANPTDQKSVDRSASAQDTFGEVSVESDGGRGVLLAGSLILLWAGIALLIVRQLVRRSVRR